MLEGLYETGSILKIHEY